MQEAVILLDYILLLYIIIYYYYICIYMRDSYDDSIIPYEVKTQDLFKQTKHNLLRHALSVHGFMSVLLPVHDNVAGTCKCVISSIYRSHM